MEIPGVGPVVLVDTAGIDDSGELGEKRVAKTKQVLNTIDLALLVITANEFDQTEKDLVAGFADYAVPYMVIHNKNDLVLCDRNLLLAKGLDSQVPLIPFSAVKYPEPDEIIRTINLLMPESAYQSNSLVGDLIKYGDVVLLITPIDVEAPEGRLILPQVQVIRDVLDHDGIAVVLKEREVDAYIRKMNPRPALVVTDSQVFPKADASIPKDIPLTSFSILLARQRGDFQNYLKGTAHISKLRDGDKVLILESCTHHVSCDDIGRMKIPRWLSSFTGKKLHYEVVSGLDLVPGKIQDYAMLIQCGGCVLTRKQVVNRVRPAVLAGIPVTNYGMAIAYVHGIFQRAISPFVQSQDVKENYL
jgi:[FeFe] hydrogenase H-cluster maturation GTPase HydF